MASSLWAEAVRRGRRRARKEGWPDAWLEGWLEGWMEGAVAESRRFCIELTRECHPELVERLAPLIRACSDIERLHEWGLQATRLPEAEFLSLVTEQAGSTSRPVGRSRTRRPSRRAKAKGTT